MSGTGSDGPTVKSYRAQSAVPLSPHHGVARVPKSPSAGEAAHPRSLFAKWFQSTMPA